MEKLLQEISAIVWGPVMLVFLLGVGIYLSLGLKGFTLRMTPSAVKSLWQRNPENTQGEISPFQALMTALSATVGTGNIAGVATAIFMGGPGAVFWMWITALFGMASKYAEAVLAVRFRECDDLGQYVGGPMYYIKNGLSEKWRFLGFSFALFGMLAAFGIGNMVQANSVADAIGTQFALPDWVTGLLLMVITACVILGGIKRIAVVASGLVPIMAIAYFSAAAWVIISHSAQLPDAFMLIINSAFNGTAAMGGFAGAAVWAAIRFGVARGVFSNEAGLGSAAIAHAAAKTEHPVQQGMIAMLGTMIDTLIICTMTALVILLTDSWHSGANGAALSTLAFNNALPDWGGYIVVFGLSVFAFTTLLGWSYYGERCAEYIFGVKIIRPYRFFWIIAIPTGATGQLNIVWSIADVMNGLMAIPNLIALVLLSPLVFELSRQYLQKL